MRLQTSMERAKVLGLAEDRKGRLDYWLTIEHPKIRRQMALLLGHIQRLEDIVARQSQSVTQVMLP
jgi:hypothetical protein